MQDDARTGRARLVLAFLLFAYILNFLDRQILGILAQPIKAELGLSDTQFGAVGGLAFALLYSVLGVPLALLADRTSRSGVIAGSLAVWSGFTALCGAAGGYLSLFLCRLGVGIGEAGGVAPSYALIADYFPPAQRARAIAIYSLGIPIGLAAGVLFGAQIAAAIGWRAVFYVMGGIGLVFAPLFMLVVRDVPRAKAAPRLADLMATLPLVARKPGFWLLALAASFSSLCGYGLAVWTPSILMRSFGFDLVTTGRFLASLTLVGGVIGVYLGGWGADRLGRRDRRWYAWLPAIAWLATAPFFWLGFNATNTTALWIFLLVPNGLNILWLGPVITAVQHHVPPEQRATASGAFLLINNLIGLGAGPLLIGALSEYYRGAYGEDSLRQAALGVLAFYFVAAGLMLVAARFVARDWVAEESEQAG